MTSPLTNKGILSSAKIMLSMALDPIQYMRKMGFASPSAILLTMGLDRHHSRKILYLTGGENVRPIFMAPRRNPSEIVHQIADVAR